MQCYDTYTAQSQYHTLPREFSYVASFQYFLAHMWFGFILNERSVSHSGCKMVYTWPLVWHGGHAGLKGTCKQIQNHYNDIIKSKSKLARKKPYLHISHYYPN